MAAAADEVENDAAVAAALQAEFDAEAAAEGVRRPPPAQERTASEAAGLSLPLEAMRNAVRRLMLRGDEAYIDGTSDEALELLTALELTLTHGLKQKAPAAGVAAIAELWAAGPPTLWSVVLALEKFHEPARKTVGFVKSCGGVADGDKGGLWLRMVLNEGCLHSMLRVLLQELPNKERFYDDDAFARSEQWVDVLLSLTAGLDQIVFQFAPPTPPVQPAAPPARALRDARARAAGGRRRARRRRAPAAADDADDGVGSQPTSHAPVANRRGRRPRWRHRRRCRRAAAGGAAAGCRARRRARRLRRASGAYAATIAQRAGAAAGTVAAPPAPSRTVGDAAGTVALARAAAQTAGRSPFRCARSPAAGRRRRRAVGGAGCIRRRCVRRTARREHRSRRHQP